MTDTLAALVSFVLFAAFVGGLALAVAEPPLLAVAGITILLLAIDFWRETRRRP